MTVHLSPDVYSTHDGIVCDPPLSVRRHGEHVCITPKVHNEREIIVALAKALTDPHVRADLLVVRQHSVASVERARALDRLTDSLDLSGVFTWCVSTADADEIAGDIMRLLEDPS